MIHDDKSFSIEDFEDLAEEIRDHVVDLDISLADQTATKFDTFNNLNSTFRSNVSDSMSVTKDTQ